jgi:transcriptional regulator GlxA family with amidase domain
MEALRARAQLGPVRVGVLLFHGYELLDVWGPVQMLVNCDDPLVRPGAVMRKAFQVQLFGEGRTPLGPEAVVDFSRAKCEPGALPVVDLLLVPGGDTAAAIADPWNRAALEWLGGNAALVLAVCNGAGFLASLGWLDGLRATTNKMDLPELATAFPKVRWQREARWVCEGKWLTSSGVAAGTDASLFLVEQLWGGRVARGVCQSAEYVPCRDPSCDPFCGNATVDWAAIRPARAARPLRVALLLYDNFELLDVFGPLECWAVANRFQAGLFSLETIAETAQVKSCKGPSFRVDSVMGQYAPREAPDVLFVPGGIGTLRELFRAETLAFIRTLVPRVSIVFTVCTGSAILARTGALDGLRATTNKLSFNLMTSFGPRVRWDKAARFVAAEGPEEKFWTSSGVAAGIDMALFLLECQHGRAFADAVAKRAEYPRPPTDSPDPFAASVPALTLLEWAKQWPTRVIIALFFRAGLALGMDMRTSRLL